jgi:hypothetical protein
MIVWIASYPRSGNTLTTQILGQVFRQLAYEKYNNFHQFIKPAGPKNNHEHVGLTRFEGTWEEFYASATESSEPVFIKTHDAPDDHAPAVYVVRDGLSATESYFHYHQNVEHHPCDWMDLILGRAFPYLSWGGHLDAWNPLTRPRTLLLRFEDLVGNPEAVLEKLAEFIGLPQVQPWQNSFQKLRAEDPAFFRQGKKEGAKDFPPGLLATFRALHGDWMQRLGYDDRQGSNIEEAGLPALRAALAQWASTSAKQFLQIRTLEESLESLRRNSAPPSGETPAKKTWSFFGFRCKD